MGPLKPENVVGWLLVFVFFFLKEQRENILRANKTRRASPCSSVRACIPYLTPNSTCLQAASQLLLSLALCLAARSALSTLLPGAASFPPSHRSPSLDTPSFLLHGSLCFRLNQACTQAGTTGKTDVKRLTAPGHVRRQQPSNV